MNWTTNLRRLRYFAAVADELHFGRAAARLHIAQPPLSRQIRSLEAELGIDLFVRNTRSVALTDAGRILYPEAKRLLGTADAVARTVDALLAGQTGFLRLGFVDSAAYELVPRFLRGFRERWPRTAVELRHMSSDDQLAALTTGDLDLGITRTTGDPTTTRACVFAHEPLFVAVPVRHRLHGIDHLTLNELAGEPLVGFDRERSRSLHAELTALFGAHGVSYSPAIEATEYSTILGIVAAGEGIAVVPAGVRTFRPPDLDYVPIVDPAARVRLVLVAAANGASSLVRDSFETIAAELTAIMARAGSGP